MTRQSQPIGAKSGVSGYGDGKEETSVENREEDLDTEGKRDYQEKMNVWYEMLKARLEIRKAEGRNSNADARIETNQAFEPGRMKQEECDHRLKSHNDDTAAHRYDTWLERENRTQRVREERNTDMERSVASGASARSG